MFSSAEGWTALGAWAQVLVLLVTARFVWLYLKATKELAASSVEQVEVQVRPAIIVCVAGDRSISLKNIGNGPAVDLEVTDAVRDSVGCYRAGTLNDFVRDRSFVEPGEEIETLSIYTQARAGRWCSLDLLDSARSGPVDATGSGFPASLQCQYRSLSGRVYWTVTDFNNDGRQVARSRFSQQELQPGGGGNGVLGFLRTLF